MPLLWGNTGSVPLHCTNSARRPDPLHHLLGVFFQSCPSEAWTRPLRQLMCGSGPHRTAPRFCPVCASAQAMRWSLHSCPRATCGVTRAAGGLKPWQRCLDPRPEASGRWRSSRLDTPTPGNGSQMCGLWRGWGPRHQRPKERGVPPLGQGAGWGCGQEQWERRGKDAMVFEK